MSIQLRSYCSPPDFERIGTFLIAHFQPGNRDGNWLQPTWEYMHSHPALDEASLGRISIWEDGGEIVAVAHYESCLGEAFFQLHPMYSFLKAELLAYAEENLYGIDAAGERYLRAFINDFDAEFEAILRSHGYTRLPRYDRPMAQLAIPEPFPKIELPGGFHLISLQEENDFYKINRVLWRGFNHPGEPPEAELSGRRKMQSVPNFRKDLNIVVAAPDGNFAAYSGAWFDPANRIAYVEPVATDPDYRRMGLGRAAVLEGIRRCGALGATTAFVGSDLAFYQALGFATVFTSACWEKRFGPFRA